MRTDLRSLVVGLLAATLTSGGCALLYDFEDGAGQGGGATTRATDASHATGSGTPTTATEAGPVTATVTSGGPVCAPILSAYDGPFVRTPVGDPAMPCPGGGVAHARGVTDYESPPVLCSCACGTEGATCQAVVGKEAECSDAGSGSEMTYASGMCHPFNGPQPIGVNAVNFVSNPTCDAQTSEIQRDPPSPVGEAALCDGGTPCEGGGLLFDSPEVACVVQAGGQCPAPYLVAYVYYQAPVDNRSCAPCACQPSQADCGGVLKTFGPVGCGAGGNPMLTEGQCADAIATYIFYEPGQPPICEEVPGVGGPTGEVEVHPDSVITFCCMG